MAPNTATAKKKQPPARPAGTLMPVNMLFPPELLNEIERYRSQALERGESKIPPRLDVIRELLNIGLKQASKK